MNKVCACLGVIAAVVSGAGAGGPVALQPPAEGWVELGDPAEAASTLRFLAAQSSGNYASLQTWEGKYRCISDTEVPRPVLERVFKGTNVPAAGSVRDRREFWLHFVVDQASNALYCEYRPAHKQLQFTEAATGRPLPVPATSAPTAPTARRVVLTQREYLRYSPDEFFPGLRGIPLPRGRPVRVAYREPPGEAVLRDPRSFFRLTEVTQPADMLQSAAEWVQAGTERVYKADVAGKSWFRWVHDTGAGKRRAGSHVHTGIFSPDAAYLPVGFRVEVLTDTSTAELVLERSWQYARCGDVWIPNRFKEVNRASLQGVGEIYEAIMESANVNTPVTDTQFTWAGLGLEDGTLVLDKVMGETYVWDQGKLRSLGRLGEPGASDRGLGLLRWGLAAFTLCAVALTIGWLWRRRRARL